MTQTLPRQLTKSVVLVDDETAYLELLSQQVTENLACPVHSFSHPETALKEIAELNVGLIISDFQMPGLNGFQFVRRVQRLLPGVPVLMITAVPEQFPEDEVLGLPALKAVVHKPFKWEELAVHIAKHWPSVSQPPFPNDGG
ncbi:MAG: response regulator [Opitutae bacterium]|nr:response regulator [Opitutae bacterium]